MGVKKIIIHAGLHKTGTSSIQSVLSASRTLLSENGIIYPSFGGNKWVNHSIPLSLLFMDEERVDYDAVRKIYPDKNARSTATEKMLEHFMLELIRSGDLSVLLSGEDFSTFRKHEIERLKYFFLNLYDCKFEIIVYVREPVSYLISGAQELVRAGIKTLGEAIGMGNLQQARMKISNLVDVFGSESVRVFEYADSGSVGWDVIKHFFGVIGISPPETMTEVPRANLDSSLEKTLVLSAIKRQQPSSLARVAQALPDQGSKIVLGEASRRKVWGACKGDVEFLRHVYGIDCQYPDYGNPSLDASVLASCSQIAVQSCSDLSLESLLDAMVDDIRGVFPELIDGIIGLKN